MTAEFDFDRIYDRLGSDSSKWHRYGPGVLPFWVADMDFRSPEPVIRALRERVDHGFFGYGRPYPEFHEVFTARLADRYGWHVEPEALVPIPGVIPGFNLACRALTSPGDGLLVQVPGYPPILSAATTHRLVRRDAHLVRQPDGSYEIDWDSFEQAIAARPRAFLLCNPHNPIGRVFRRDEVERMATLCLRNGVFIIADEIHCDIIYPPHAHTPIGSVHPELERRTITLMAPSKTFNLPGLKAAVAVIPNPELRERFERARGGILPVGVNLLGYTAMVAAYRDGGPWLEALLRYLAANRDHLSAFVRDHLAGVAMTPTEGTYLAWLDFRGASIPGDDPFTWFLERAQVALSDGRGFGPGATGFARFNFACPRPMLDEGLERIRRALLER